MPFTNNQSSGTGGGGLFQITGPGSITGSATVFSLNKALAGSGGAIHTEGSGLTMDGVALKNNEAAAGGGGLFNAGTATTVGQGEIAENKAPSGAGILNTGTATFTNVTVSANTTSSPTTFEEIRSDGAGATVNLVLSTVFAASANSTDLTGLGHAALQSANGGAITLSSSLIGGTCNTPLTSSGGNLETPGNTCGLTGAGDQHSVAAKKAKVKSLALNGGTTRTRAIGTKSAAVDEANLANCGMLGGVTADQRGVTRVQAAACDVGAFEKKGNPGDVPTAANRAQLQNLLNDASNDTIVLAASNSVGGVFAGGQLDINRDVDILGHGDGSTIESNVAGTRVLQVGDGSNAISVGLSDLSIAGGDSAGNGGGVWLRGNANLDLENVTIEGSSAAGDGGGVYADTGTTLSLVNSTLSGNIAGNEGTAIRSAGDLELDHVTIVDPAGASGAGSTVEHSTGDLSATNTILDGKCATSDGTPATSSVNLLTGTPACGFTQVADLRLDALRDNTGSNGNHPKTHALETASLALDAATLETQDDDQRGEPRAVDGLRDGPKSDAGSFEAQPLLVDRTDDAAAATACTAAANDCSLRGAIQTANGQAGYDLIGVPVIGGPSTTYTLTGPGGGDLDITQPVGIVGLGATPSDVVISGGGIDRAFDVAAPTGISNVTIRDGSASTGAGVQVQSAGTLEMKDVVVTNNTATLHGGGISADANANVQLDNVDVANNDALGNPGVGQVIQGGGIWATGAGTVSLTSGSTVTTNAAEDQAGGSVADGGGVWLGGGRELTMVGGSITDNTAERSGGGIAISGGASAELTGAPVIQGNEATTGDGGGVLVSGASPDSKIEISSAGPGYAYVRTNTAGGNGAGLAVLAGADAELTRVALNQNNPATDGTPVFVQGLGSTISLDTCDVRSDWDFAAIERGGAQASVTLKNTVIAGGGGGAADLPNANDGVECVNGPFTSQGGNQEENDGILIDNPDPPPPPDVPDVRGCVSNPVEFVPRALLPLQP